MTAQSTLIFVGICLGFLSLGYSLPGGADSHLKAWKVLSMKRQAGYPPDSGICQYSAYLTGGITQTCITALDTYNETISLCNPVCNSLYYTSVTCYGAAATEAYYKAACPNGYLGTAVQLNFSVAVVLVLALIASYLHW